AQPLPAQTVRVDGDHDLLLLLLFFFQAEDGIRDYKVTGVQTCALPISRVLAEVGAGRAGTWRRGAALLDVTCAGRRGRRHEQRHDDRAGNPDGRLVDVPRSEGLAVGVVEDRKSVV